MKQHYFISGLPRSGSTLLSAILKQNPEFYADISSPVEALIGTSIDIITSSESNFLFSENQRKNLLHGIFNSYYQHIENPIIFDTSRMWTRKTSLLKALFPHTKILCPVRDIISILNSFEIITSKNPFYSNEFTDKISVFERCDRLMNAIDNGVVVKSLGCLKQGYALNPEMIYFIEYEKLCKEPEKTMRGVYKFLEKPYYSHDFENVEYSNENFDKVCNLKNLHTVRKKVEYKPPRCVLPPDIVKKYSTMNMEFWRENNEMNQDIIEYK